MTYGNVDGYKSVSPSTGIVYPCVAREISGINFAIKPYYASEVLVPSKVYKIKILENPSPHLFITQITHSSKSITKGGKINWQEETGPVEKLTDLPLH